MPSCSQQMHQAKDEDDPELEHGKAHDDMWTLDLNTLKVRLINAQQTALLLSFAAWLP
jgi:hypothetical protein